MARAFAAGARSTPATCSSFPIRHGLDRSLSTPNQRSALICTIVDPITREPYDRDPRGVAEKAEAYLKSTGIADTAYLRTGSGILYFRRSALYHHREFLLPSGRQCRRALEQRRGKNFRISVTRSAQRKAIFRSRQPTACRISATKCVSSWRKPAFRSSANITKSRPRVRLRSTFVSPR